jgi:hypothetical protein
MLTGLWAVLGLTSWGPVLGSLGDPNVEYNVARLDLYLPIPFLAGAGYVLLALLSVPRAIWRVAEVLLIAGVLLIAIAALGSQAKAPIEPAIGPAPVQPGVP